MIFLHGVGHFHPENIIDNQFLEDLDIGSDKNWVQERVGIVTRRTVLPLDYIRTTKNANPQAAQEASLYTNGQTGAKAALMALGRAKLPASDIGLVISGSCTPQQSCPAEACMIAAQLGIEAIGLDVNSACSSLAAQLNVLNWMDPQKLPPYILIVSPENNTRQVNYADRNTAVLWGDCSTALVVSTQVPSKYVIQHTCLQSSPQGAEKVVFPSMGHFRQEGKVVQAFAIKKSLMIIQQMRQHLTPEQLPKMKYIGHQANFMMLKSVVARAEIPEQNHYFNVNQFGNCGAAGAPSVLSLNWEQLRPQDILLVAVVGGGLTWGGALIEVQTGKV